MRGDAVCAVARERKYRLRPFESGEFVRTPTGRVARVIGYLTDDRLDLRYCDSVTTGHANEVSLPANLLRPYS